MFELTTLALALCASFSNTENFINCILILGLVANIERRGESHNGQHPLGWLRAKAIVENHGMFWAWFIRVLQDVVLFSVVTAQDLDVSASWRSYDGLVRRDSLIRRYPLAIKLS